MQLKLKPRRKEGRYISGKHEARAKIDISQTKILLERRTQILQRRHARHLKAAWTFKAHQSKMANKQKARARAEGIQL